MNWVRNSFIESAYESILFTTNEQNEFIDIKNYRSTESATIDSKIV